MRQHAMQKIFDEIIELAEFHSVPIELVYGDGTVTHEPAVTLEELRMILQEIRDSNEVEE